MNKKIERYGDNGERIYFIREENKLKIAASDGVCCFDIDCGEADKAIDELTKNLKKLRETNLDKLKDKLKKAYEEGFSLYEMEDLHEEEVGYCITQFGIEIRNKTKILVIDEDTEIVFGEGKLKIKDKNRYWRTFYLEKKERFDF